MTLMHESSSDCFRYTGIRLNGIRYSGMNGNFKRISVLWEGIMMKGKVILRGRKLKEIKVEADEKISHGCEKQGENCSGRKTTKDVGWCTCKTQRNQRKSDGKSLRFLI